MFNVGFLSSGVTRACLNAVGKMPVRRDVLIMCVSAGKSVGEIAWRRGKGIGSRGHVVGWLERRSLDTSASVRGQKEKLIRYRFSYPAIRYLPIPPNILRYDYDSIRYWSISATTGYHPMHIHDMAYPAYV